MSTKTTKSKLRLRKSTASHTAGKPACTSTTRFPSIRILEQKFKNPVLTIERKFKEAEPVSAATCSIEDLLTQLVAACGTVSRAATPVLQLRYNTPEAQARLAAALKLTHTKRGSELVKALDEVTGWLADADPKAAVTADVSRALARLICTVL